MTPIRESRARLLCLIASALLIAARGGAQCDSCAKPSFGPAVRIYPASNGKDIAVADFNLDGVPDVVVVNGAAASPAVVVYLGTGTGSLGVGTTIAKAAATAVVAADFNGDGIPDIATSADFASSTLIFLGLGDGSFQDPIEVSGGGAPINAADLNGDGVLDLILSPGPLYVLLGNGDGTFQSPSVAPLKNDLIYGPIAVADFDGDGRLDTAANSSEGIVILLGNGDGTFRPPRPTGLRGVNPAAGDFNGDGAPDLVVDLWDAFDEGQILIGGGDGTFSAGQTFATGPGPNNFVIADLDGDGRLDVAVSTNQTASVSILIGRGDGSFAPPVGYATTGGNGRIVSADFDGDGSLDLAVLSTYFSVVQILLSQGGGRIAAPPTSSLSLSASVLYSYTSPVLADFTGDSIPDIVVSNPGSKQLALGRGDGTGVFTTLSHLDFTDPVIGFAVADLDGDGNMDIVVDTNLHTIPLLGNGDGSFRRLEAFGLISGLATIGDFNGDGKPDLAKVRYDEGQIDVYPGSGDGTFGDSVSFARNKPQAIAAADFDGDGFSDLAILSPQNNAVWIALGGPGGQLSLAWTMGNLIGLQFLALGDANGDGKTDVVVSYDNGTHLATFLSHGDGSFSDPVTSKGFQLGQPVIADLTGDGAGDLISGGGSSLYVQPAIGDGSFGEPVGYAASFLPSIAAGDLNGDSRIDLVAVVPSSPVLVTSLVNTRCEPKRLALTHQPTSCDVPGSAFETQPVVKVFDDGDNVVACDTGTVTASIAAGTGSPGAVLQGTAAVAAVAGVATFSDLGIDLAGRGYRLEFSHPLAGTTRSRTLSQGLTVALNGPALTCDSFPPTYRTGAPGYDRYVWKLDEVEVSRGPMPTLAGLSTGDHTLEVDVFQDDCTASQSRTITVQTGPAAPSIGAPLSVPAAATGLLASVTSHPGSSYHWSLLGGTITAGQGTEEVTFTAGPAGTTMTLEAIEVSAAGCESPADHARIQVDFADVPLSDPFHDAVNAMARNGISHGCGGGSFCPDALLTRDQMAIFLLKTEHGGNYLAPPSRLLRDRIRRRRRRGLRRYLHQAAWPREDHYGLRR